MAKKFLLSLFVAFSLFAVFFLVAEPARAVDCSPGLDCSYLDIKACVGDSVVWYMGTCVKGACSIAVMYVENCDLLYSRDYCDGADKIRRKEWTCDAGTVSCVEDTDVPKKTCDAPVYSCQPRELGTKGTDIRVKESICFDGAGTAECFEQSNIFQRCADYMEFYRCKSDIQVEHVETWGVCDSDPAGNFFCGLKTDITAGKVCSSCTPTGITRCGSFKPPICDTPDCTKIPPDSLCSVCNTPN